MLINPLWVAPADLQQVVDCAHVQLIRRELADVQQHTVPVILTVHLREASLQLFVDTRANVVAMIEHWCKKILWGQGCGEKRYIMK